MTILLVLFKTEQLSFVNKYFFVSLTAADLCVGLFVTPFSLWTALFDHWIYGEKFCHMEAYLAAIFWIASVYSFTWQSIDHYVAIRKPDRYESLMTPMRCICWVAFVWLAAISFCLPPLFGVSHALYYSQAFVCIIDWNLQKGYFITAGLLIIVPPAIATAISNLFIFTDTYQRKKIVYQKCADSDARPEHYFANFLVGIMYLLAWGPWCMLQVHEIIHNGERFTAHPKLHFYFMWFAIGNSLWKFVIYVIFDHDFRIGLKILYTKINCKCSK